MKERNKDEDSRQKERGRPRGGSGVSVEAVEKMEVAGGCKWLRWRCSRSPAEEIGNESGLSERKEREHDQVLLV